MFCGMDIRLCVAFRAVCSFCNYVVFSRVMSVQYCLCVSRISVHSVQCQSIASAQFYSVQCKQCSESVQFLKLSVYTVICSIQSMVFSVSWVTVYGVHGLPTIIQCR